MQFHQNLLKTTPIRQTWRSDGDNYCVKREAALDEGETWCITCWDHYCEFGE